MGDEINSSFTEGQKNAIYKEMLMPLKLKISQILLYDTEAALEFLQKYNEIIKNEDSLGNEIIKIITDLEFEIQQYMSKEGKEKVFEERSKAILQSIYDLKTNSIQLSLEDFENEFSKLKKDYEENIENYSFDDRDKIEREIYALQANLIMRQVASGRTADEIQQTITEQDKIGLNIFIAEQINLLKQKDGLKDIATKVNNIVMTDSNAVLNPKLWSWLNAAERGIKRDEQSQMIQPSTSTAMTVAPKKKNNTLVDKISRFFSREPVFPLQIGDLRKINIEWLSKYIPVSMLLELENDRLSEENRQVDDRYVPDSRVVIHKLIYNEIKKQDREQLYIQEYELLLESGSKLKVTVSENWHINGWKSLRDVYVTMKVNDSYKSGHYYDYRRGGVFPLNGILSYAGFLDEIFKLDIQQQLLKEIKAVTIDRTSKQIPIYNALKSSWDCMFSEYESTKLDVEATEQAKRKQFYERWDFKQKLKRQDTKDGIETEVQDANEKIKQHVEPNEEGQEQGGE